MQYLISYILPLFYLVLFAWLLQRNKYYAENGLQPAWIMLFFVAKCAAGILADYISIHFFENGGDVMLFYQDGLALNKILLENPSSFGATLKHMFHLTDFDLLNSHSDFIRTVFEGIKFIHFIANFFSLGNVYTNTILFNALAVPAILSCWIFLKNYTGSRVAGAIVFLFPSAFFYTSNILKEGICYLLLAWLIPLCFSLYQQVAVRSMLKAVGLFLLLFFFKFLIAISFLLAILIWWLCSKWPERKSTILAFSLVLIGSLFFVSAYVPGLPNLPAYLAARQHEFISLNAETMMPVSPLEANFLSYVRAFPRAIFTVLFKPLPGEGGKILLWVHTAEILLFWIMIVLLAIRSSTRPNLKGVQPLIVGMLAFAVINLLIIGYTVPVLGAMVRYRSIFLPWILLFCWALLNGNQSEARYSQYFANRISK